MVVMVDIHSYMHIFDIDFWYMCEVTHALNGQHSYVVSIMYVHTYVSLDILIK